MKRMNIVLTMMLLVSIIMIGAGMTGLVVSQSCCFPPNCAVDNLCSSAKFTQSPVQMSTVLGFAMFVFTLIMFNSINRKKHEHNTEEDMRF